MPEANSKETLDDIVFESRNKTYGAFDLRQRYRRNINIAFWSTMLVMTIGYLGYLVANRVNESLHVQIPKGVDIDLSKWKDNIPDATAKAEPKITAPPLAIQPPPPVKDDVPKPVTEVKTEVPKPQPDPKPVVNKPAEPDTKSTSSTPPNTADPQQGGKSGAQDGNSDVITPFFKIEEMPRFPGCENAAMSIKEKEACANEKYNLFVKSNLSITKEAMDKNISGKAIISFVVDKKGNIKDVKIVSDPGAGLGDVAKKLIESMNNLKEGKWTPAKSAGHYVNVRHTATLTFSTVKNKSKS